MRTAASTTLTFAISALLLGCPHESAPARAQEAATELNVNTRFGRMELAAEHVAPAQREAFMSRRKAWGNNLRVADYELAGFAMKGSSDAEMIVKVAWYRVDQGDLRVTLVKQKWHDFKGAWKLVDEGRAEGDIGLLGEPPPPAPPRATGPARFPTIRLGETAPPEKPSEEKPSEN